MFKLDRGVAVLAIATPLALGLTASAPADADAHPNATPACGSTCIDVSSKILGPGTILNAFVPGDTGTGAKAGQLINMNYASNSHPNEDFTVQNVGAVSDFCRSDSNPDGPLYSDSALCIHDKTGTVYEVNVSPFGGETGLCAGTTGTPYAGLQVRLVGCGTTEGWLIVQGPSVRSGGLTYNTYISGATQSFSHPFVFTVNPGRATPQNKIVLAQENFLSGSVASDNQLFALTSGPVS